MPRNKLKYNMIKWSTVMYYSYIKTYTYTNAYTHMHSHTHTHIHINTRIKPNVSTCPYVPMNALINDWSISINKDENVNSNPKKEKVCRKKIWRNSREDSEKNKNKN